MRSPSDWTSSDAEGGNSGVQKRGGVFLGVKKGGYFGGQKRGLFGGPKRVIFGVQKPPLVYSEKRSNPPHVSDHELPHFGQKTAPGGINSTPFWTPQKRGIFDPFLTLFWGTPKKVKKGGQKGGVFLRVPQKRPPVLTASPSIPGEDGDVSTGRSSKPSPRMRVC